MFPGKQVNLWLALRSRVRRLRDESLLRNSVFIMVSSMVTSAIGYLYWVLAAHIYSTYDIGLASALIAAMSLTSTFANLGIGSALVQALPRRETGYAWSLTLNACIVMGTLTSVLAGAIVIIILSLFLPQFNIIEYNIDYSLTFIIGTAVCTITTLLDQTFIAERATSNMVIRNAAFALIKLVILIILFQIGALGIFSSWVMALAASIVLAGLILIPRLKRNYCFVIDKMMKQIRPMLSSFIGHHLINIGSMLPMYLLPVLVSIRLSVTDNAYFYTTWMLGGLFFMVSPAVATALFSEGSHTTRDVMSKARTSILTICIMLGPIMLVFFLGGRYILLLFGPSYPQHGLLLLTYLIIATVPDAITNVYVSLLRVQRRLQQAALLNLGMAILALIFAWIFLPSQGVAGAGLAWLIAQSAGSVLVGVDFLIARNRLFVDVGSDLSRPRVDADSAEGYGSSGRDKSLPRLDSEAISLIDTAIVPIVRLLYSNQVHSDDAISKINAEASGEERTTDPCASPGFHNRHASPFRHITMVPLREEEMRVDQGTRREIPPL